MEKAGAVFVAGKRAGVIRQTDEGYEFSYDASYVKRNDALAVSLTLPLTEEPYRSKALFPFFDGLIPEGWLLHVAERNWKIDGRDRFSLLLVTCSDCIGDVRIEALP